MSDASLRMIDGRAVVEVGGSELLGIQVAKALGYRNDAAGSAGQAAASADTAQTARDATLAASNYFPSRAAGEAATAVNKLFSTDDAGELVSYRRTSGGSTEIARTLSAARLASATGAAGVGFKPYGTGGRRTTIAQVLDLTVNAGTRGWIGDSGYHALSERYPTLAAAQADYPSATDLSESIDHWAIQSSIDEAARRGAALQRRAVVKIPGGRARLHGSLRLPNTVELVGEGAACTYIDNQNTPLNVPLIVNASTGNVELYISNLSLHGGTHGIKIDSGSEGQVGRALLDRVSFQLQSDKCVEVNRLLQVADFNSCVFGLSPYAVWVDAFTTNAVNFYNCNFESISHAALTIRGAECVGMYGGRLEAGGEAVQASFTGSISGTTLTVSSVFNGPIRVGGFLRKDAGAGGAPVDGTGIIRQISGTKGAVGTYEVSHSQTLASRTLLNFPAAIDLRDAACVNFRNVYFENVPQDLLRDWKSRDGVSFDACHFTQGLAPGGFPGAFRMWSDGVVDFGSNDQSVYPVHMPAAALVRGQSPKLFGNTNIYSSRTPGSTRFRSRHIELTTGAIIPAVRISRDAATAGGMTSGVLTVGLLGYDNNTGAVIRCSRKFDIIIYPNASVLFLEKQNAATIGTPLTANIDIQGATGATATSAAIEINVSGLNASTPSSIYWVFEEDGMSLKPEEYLRVACA